jgi:F-type H+-transporting ATPase subunit b
MLSRSKHARALSRWPAVARLAGAVIATLLLAGVAVASEDAHGAHGHEGGIPFGSLLLSAANLLIFLWVLNRFMMPAVRTWVADRRSRVVEALEQAATAKAEAERLRAEWQVRLSELERTAAEMRAQARRDAERERDRILATAHHLADTIRRDAERTAAYETRRIQDQLRAELVRAAVQLAEEQTRAGWTAADQQRFVAEFLKQVQA